VVALPFCVLPALLAQAFPAAAAAAAAAFLGVAALVLRADAGWSSAAAAGFLPLRGLVPDFCCGCASFSLGLALTTLGEAAGSFWLLFCFTILRRCCCAKLQEQTGAELHRQASRSSNTGEKQRLLDGLWCGNSCRALEFEHTFELKLIRSG
jgi:hypothetical protein